MPLFRSWTCVTFAALGCAVSGCSQSNATMPEKGQAKAAETAQKVEVVAVTSRAWPRSIRAQGSLISDESSIIGSRVAGRIAESRIELGDRVKEGSILAKMDTADFESRVAQVEASLLQACVAVGLKSPDEVDDLKRENSPAVRQEKAILDQAQSNLARAERLRAQQAVTDAEIDQFQAAVDVADARHASSLNAVEEKIATIRARKAELDLARQALADAVIVAPFEGAVELRTVAPGTFVNVGDPIATLVRTNPIRFRGQVPERAALKLRVGQTIEITFENEKQPCASRIERISPVLDEETRSLTFEAELANADGRLRPGLFATALVQLDTDDSTIAVPSRAVSEFAGVERVWKVVDGEAQEAVVRTGDRLGGLIEILSGLDAGDLIVLDGNTIHSGKVEVTRQVSPDDFKLNLGRQESSSTGDSPAGATTSE
jgi:multidrug efflux pump subunit AcrA (membrane-fusion protein)